MTMFHVFPLLSWKSLVGSVDDDWVDRMNHKWTVSLVLMSAVFVSSGQHLAHPIQCWCPAEFKKWYRRYARNYCWISNTYRVPMYDVIPSEEDMRQDAELSYYQWVPVILLVQAFLFKLPYITWHLINPTCGINLSRLCKLVDDIQAESTEIQRETIQEISRYLHRWIMIRRGYRNSFVTKLKRVLSYMFLFCFGNRFGVYLSGLYIFTKLLYLANCCLQFWLMGEFLQIDFWRYGPDNIRCLFGDCSAVQESPKFPRVTLCDFEIRQMQNIQPFTVQCVLPINIFNEKIFIMLWVWIVVVGVFTFFNLLSWLKYMFLRSSRQNFIKKHLIKKVDEAISRDDVMMMKKFADKYLRHDGCFLMMIVQRNTSDVTVKDLFRELWQNYVRLHGEEEGGDNDDNDKTVPIEETDLSGAVGND